MNQTDFSLTKLWPNFSSVLQGDVQTAEGLSALFVTILLIIAISFSLVSVWNFMRAKTHLKFYRKLLAGLNSDELLEKRREIVNAALENDEYGRLWREFDESLVHIPQKQRLCNTLDAAHFFNTHTLARRLTENRLLAAVPGFLTAIGVIGTFVGLQLGLGPLGSLDPQSAEVDQLKLGIFGMIGGASVAFLTSVWGVFTSVIFNFFEKALERNIRASISSFQNEVDYLYPRITAEQSLTNIEDFSRQSTEKLAELDEKIGHRLQEVMQETSGAIREGLESSLNTILAPAIERIVESAHSGSEKALESLLERFLEGVGSAGSAQKEMMEKAAKDIAEASGGMTAGLVGFASKLDSQIESIVEKNREVIGSLDAAVKEQLDAQGERDEQRQKEIIDGMNRFMAEMTRQMDNLSDKSAQAVLNVQGDLSKQIEDQQGREIARQKILHDQLKGFQQNQQEITTVLNSLLGTQRSQNEQMMDAMGGIVNRMEKLAVSQGDATEALQKASSEMRTSSNYLKVLSDNLKGASDKFSDQLIQTMAYAEKVAGLNESTAAQFTSLGKELAAVNESMRSTAKTLDGAAEQANSGLSAVDRHFNSLSDSLNTHVESLQDQVANLLSDYAERVQSQTVTRLNEWNMQTNEYISAMTDAIRAISSVVDEIENKVSVRSESSIA